MLGKKNGLIIVVLMLIAGAFYGCVNLGKGTERLPRLYLLSAMASVPETASVIADRDIAIGIGPLAFPEYLNRPQIVTRMNGRELQAAPFANWAEPLQQNVMRVLTDNLTILAQTEAVYSYPWPAGLAPLYQLQMEVSRFDADRSGEAVLAVRWEWVDRTGKPLMGRKHSVLRVPLAGEGDDDVAASMSRLLLDYSRLAVAVLGNLVRL